jgi:hypothetical protein
MAPLLKGLKQVWQTLFRQLPSPNENVELDCFQ